MAKPDVLEVLNDAKRRLAERGCSAIELGNAIDKLSELIAADVEYDAAKKALDEAEAEWEWRSPNSDYDAIREKINAATDKFNEAEERRAAALAACRGL